MARTPTPALIGCLLARRENLGTAIVVVMVSYAMLGRIADAQMMLARRRKAGTLPMTISQMRKRASHWRQEDVELYTEACRIAGVPE